MNSLANWSNRLEIEFDANPIKDLVDFVSLKSGLTKRGFVIFVEESG